MIQRKQTLWLFIAALLNAGVFYFDLYKTHTVINGVDTLGQLRVADHYPSLLIALVMTLFPLITIFMFRDRKRQMRMSFVGVIAIASFITMLLGRVTNLSKQVPPPSNGSYWIGAVLPVIALVFIFLAIFGIRRDEKLVKSVDRLR
jgi:FtsH-binding integral membrane protein